jgi:hypothetical protein
MIPEIALEAVVNNKAIEIYPFPYEDGQLPDYEARILMAILRAHQPKAVLEIGTFFGHTTLRMAKTLPTATIHTIDLPPNSSLVDKTDHHLINRRKVGREFRNRPECSRIVQYLADTATFDFIQIKEPRPTFFFIDGSHSYEYCKNDSEKCYALCNGHGTFVWHDADMNHPEVLKFLEEWYANGRDIRIIAGTRLAYYCTSK